MSTAEGLVLVSLLLVGDSALLGIAFALWAISAGEKPMAQRVDPELKRKADVEELGRLRGQLADDPSNSHVRFKVAHLASRVEPKYSGGNR